MDEHSAKITDDAGKILSGRQVECLALAAQGLTSKQIAKAIGLSPSTVDNHISSAVGRLGARNRVEAARFMLQNTSSSLSESTLIIESRSPTRERESFWRSVVTLPPLGGRPNEMSRKRRLMHIVQITALMSAVFSGVILTIAGVVYVFA